jgi:PAS domain-containing protein
LTTVTKNASSERSAGKALVLAPHGRDSAVATALLAEVGLKGLAVSNVPELAAALNDDIDLVVATEEALFKVDLEPFARFLRDQPSWSDLPVVILTPTGEQPGRTSDSSALVAKLGNVTFLERPFRPATFVSVVTAAHKARLRQYDAKARIEELAEGRERLKIALVAGHLGTWALELSNMALTTSEACKAVFGREPDESFSYHDLITSIYPDDAARMRAALDATVSTGADYAVEFRTVWPNRSLHWVEFQGKRVEGKDEGASRIVGVSSDITERKTFEQRLLELNETLERRVTERTAALHLAHARALDEARQREQAEEQLLQAQKVEAIGQLTGGVAHDFNNLLMAVLANLELLRKRITSDDKALRLVDAALEGAQRGAALTQRLLAFARKQLLLIRPADIGALVVNLEPLLRQSVGAAIDIRIAVPPTPIFAGVDEHQIELAILTSWSTLAMPCQRAAWCQSASSPRPLRGTICRRAGATFQFRLRITGAAWIPKRFAGRSSPSFRRRVSARAPGWACR